MRIELLIAAALIGCSSLPEPKPKASPLDAPYVRVITSKSDILYNYKLRGDSPTGYELAEADANKICKSRWGLQAVPKTQVTCGSHNDSATICAAAFKCQ